MIDLVARTTAGGLGLEELNRLADRGIPVFTILEEKLGLTRLEISQVGKTAEGAAQIIAALTEGLEEQFGGASLARAQNLNQILNNLGDTTDDLKDTLFQAGFGRFFKTLAIGFGAFVEEVTKLVGGKDSLNGFFDGLADSIFKVISNALLAGAAIYDALAPVFSIALTGLKNLIGFLDGLPAELKTIGIIGFLFLGTKGKLIILAITQSVDIVLGLINKIIGAFEWMVNKGVDAINTLIKTYNKIPGLPDIDLAEKVSFGRIDIDKAKEKLRELSDKLFDAIGLTSTFTEEGMTGAVGTALENAKATVEKFLADYGKDLNTITPKGDGDDEGDGGANTFASGWKRAFEEFQTSANDAASYGETIFSTFTDGITDAILNFVETGKLSFKDMFKTLLAEIIKFQTMKVVSGFFSMFGGGSGIFSSLFAGGKATGGYIPSGRFGIAGESGAELVRGPATVSSHEDSLAMLGGSGRGTSVTYNINAVDAQSFKQLVAQDPEFIYNVTRVGQRRMPQ